jgi:hypothetical protein
MVSKALAGAILVAAGTARWTHATWPARHTLFGLEGDDAVVDFRLVAKQGSRAWIARHVPRYDPALLAAIKGSLTTIITAGRDSARLTKAKA